MSASIPRLPLVLVTALFACGHHPPAPKAAPETAPEPATETVDDPAGKSDSAACSPPRVMLILDRSSSMQTGFIGGDTKWTIAVDAVDSLASQYQGSLELGLMQFPSPNQCSPGTVFVNPALNTRS